MGLYIHVVVKPIHSQIYLDRYAHINVSLVYSFDDILESANEKSPLYSYHIKKKTL